MPDKSTPNPSDPDPDKPSQARPRPRLKLKRLVVKDIKINPHEDPNAGPAPRAEAYSEPDPPHVDPLETHVSESSREAELIEAELPPPPEPQGEPAQPTASLSLEKPDPEETKPPPKKTEIPPQKGPTPAAEKKRHRRSSILFPLILIVGSLLYGTHLIFDPLGLRSDPIVQPDVPLQPEQPEETDTELQEVVSIPDPPILQASGPLNEVQVFVNKLSRQPLEISTNPDGIFIDSVHYSEGMAVNPSLGLVIESISTEPGHQHVQLIDGEGMTYTIPVN